MSLTRTVHDLKEFYSQRRGRLVRRFLTSHIRDLWPDIHGQRLMGVGYCLPYLNNIGRDAERNFAFMPQGMGAHYWPEGEKGRVFLGDETDLPIETESVDRILIIHGLEFFDRPSACFHEMWRVLKSSGRLMVVVPNRLGFWARAERTPFGHGRPYSVRQMTHLLQDNMFIHERTEQALFMPPFKSFPVMRTAYAFESLGRYIFPGLAGVHMVEASKQIYAGSAKAPAGGFRRGLGVKQAMPTQ